jgi:hypothetical protein
VFAVDGSADVWRLASTMNVHIASRRLRGFIHELLPADILLPHPAVPAWSLPTSAPGPTRKSMSSPVGRSG